MTGRNHSAPASACWGPRERARTICARLAPYSERAQLDALDPTACTGGPPKRNVRRRTCGYELERDSAIKKHSERMSSDGSVPRRALRETCEDAPMDFADSAALNEDLFRTINERIEEGAKQHGVEQPLPFHCECADDACIDKIELVPTEYDRVASHFARFVVIPGHQEPSIEIVVEQHPSYFVVEKTGEARAEIEREHPRPRHRK